MASVLRLYVILFTDSEGIEHEFVLDETEADQLAEFISNSLPQEKKPSSRRP